MGEDGRAAERMLGGSPLVPPAIEAQVEVRRGVSPGPLFCDAGRWRGLAEEIHRAAAVDFYGIVPGPLIEALLQLLAPGDEGRELPPIAYYTPHPSEILSTYNERVRTRLALRWQVGFMGLRNLIDAASQRAEGERETAPAALFTIPGSFSECIVSILDETGRRSVRYFAILPPRPGASETSRFMEASPNAGTEALEEYLRELATDAPRLRLREVLCLPVADDGGRDADEDPAPAFQISGFAPYAGHRRTAAEPRLKPIAIVALRFRHVEGDQMLLKVRSEWTDIDQFGKLSFLSARVQEADLAAALKKPVEETDSDSEALDRLWRKQGRPEPFFLPDQAFRLAARRELFLVCGLSLPDDRLDFDGIYVLNDQNGPDQYGFAVFHVTLEQEPRDEVELALRRNPTALRAVPLEKLRDGSHGYELNRLLHAGWPWLSRRTLAKTREVEPVDG